LQKNRKEMLGETTKNPYQLSLFAKERCRRRSAIEGLISHLKNYHKLGRNFLKGYAFTGRNALNLIKNVDLSSKKYQGYTLESSPKGV
jgi:hypothetical protein